MALSSPGLGSGLDVSALVNQLMALERRPAALLDTKEARYQTQLTAYGSLKGALSAFQGTVAALSSAARFSAVNATLADPTVATASASSAATAGSYAIEVQTLAQAQKLKSAAFAATSTEIGAGTLTLQFGTYSGGVFTANADKAAQNITIDAGKSSLAGVRDAINAANAGVSASIINDGSGNRLVLASKDSGVANALKITVADADLNHTDNAGLSQLAYNAASGGVMNLTQTVAAQNATFVVDGIAISKAANTISDAIEGVTLNLLKTNTPATTALSVSRDSAGTQSAVQSFVNAFNDINKTITSLSKYNAATKQASTLTGDASVRTIQAQLRRVFNSALPANGSGLNTLADIGITFQKDGTLKLDAAKLTSVLSDTSKDVSSLFAVSGKASDSLVSYLSAAADTKDGSYLVNVSQLATQGRAVAGTAAALTINAGVNDTLSLSVDGVSAAVTLGAGVYSADTLAAEIQSKINGVIALSAAGAAVKVSHAAGVLSITSNRYGSASAVVLSGGTAQAGLFGTQIETAGVDVSGSIGAMPASGAGQTLTGAGEASGLALRVSGGLTGFRGSVSSTHGYASQLDKLAGKILDNDSQLDSRMDGISASIKSIGSQREALVQRLASIEKRYRAQYSTLDGMIASMSKTSNFLQQQLANLPKAGSL